MVKMVIEMDLRFRKVKANRGNNLHIQHPIK